MIRVMINNWWLLLLRGVFALVFAAFVFGFQPFFSTMLLAPWATAGVVVVFGLLTAVSGLITVAACLRRSQKKRDLWTLLAEGATMLGAGAVILFFPGLTFNAIVMVIACAALLLGLLEIAAGIHLRRHLADEWLLIAGGATSLAFSLYLFFAHSWQVPSLLNWIAAYAAANGLAMAGLALRLRGLRESVHHLAEPHAAHTTAGHGSDAA
ncbi:MAG TPA: DUF308 domain-containing protein [Candidatus Angelobacter sp.]